MSGNTSSNDFDSGATLRSSTSRPIAAESTASTSGASLRISAPSGSVISTGGGGTPASGGSR